MSDLSFSGQSRANNRDAKKSQSSARNTTSMQKAQYLQNYSGTERSLEITDLGGVPFVQLLAGEGIGRVVVATSSLAPGVG